MSNNSAPSRSGARRRQRGRGRQPRRRNDGIKATWKAPEGEYWLKDNGHRIYRPRHASHSRSASPRRNLKSSAASYSRSRSRSRSPARREKSDDGDRIRRRSPSQTPLNYPSAPHSNADAVPPSKTSGAATPSSSFSPSPSYTPPPPPRCESLSPLSLPRPLAPDALQRILRVLDADTKTSPLATTPQLDSFVKFMHEHPGAYPRIRIHLPSIFNAAAGDVFAHLAALGDPLSSASKAALTRLSAFDPDLRELLVRLSFPNSSGGTSTAAAPAAPKMELHLFWSVFESRASEDAAAVTARANFTLIDRAWRTFLSQHPQCDRDNFPILSSSLFFNQSPSCDNDSDQFQGINAARAAIHGKLWDVAYRRVLPATEKEEEWCADLFVSTTRNPFVMPLVSTDALVPQRGADVLSAFCAEGGEFLKLHAYNPTSSQLGITRNAAGELDISLRAYIRDANA